MLGFGYFTDTNGSGVTVEIFETKLHELFRHALMHVEVDEAWYRATYADVDQAIRAGVTKSAQEHYVTAGYFENRLPRSIKVDEAWYLQTYPDVAMAMRDGSFSSAKQHFESNGYQEGRLPQANWSLLHAAKPRVVRVVA